MLKNKVAAKYIIVEGSSADLILNKIEKISQGNQFINDWLDEGNVEIFIKENLLRNGDVESEAELTEAIIFDEARSTIEERFNDFHSEFVHKAKFRGNGIIGYRCMNVKDVNKFIHGIKTGNYQKGFQGVGIYYSWDRSAAHAHWAGDGESVMVQAIIPADAIDFEGMARANMDYSLGEAEKEITVKAGAKIIVKSIINDDGVNVLDKDTLSLPAVASVKK